jgi:hypothetical protein
MEPSVTPRQSEQSPPGLPHHSSFLSSFSNMKKLPVKDSNFQNKLSPLRMKESVSGTISVKFPISDGNRDLQTSQSELLLLILLFFLRATHEAARQICYGKKK